MAAAVTPRAGRGPDLPPAALYRSAPPTTPTAALARHSPGAATAALWDVSPATPSFAGPNVSLSASFSAGSSAGPDRHALARSLAWWHRAGGKLRPQFSVNLSDFSQRGACAATRLICTRPQS